MTIILKAYSPADGMAIADKDQRLRLIRPPYKQINSMELPESAVQDAILNHDFHASDKQFESWKSLIDFLNQQLIEYRQSRGHPVPEMLNSVEILDVAPLEILQGFLDKVKNELIPQLQFEHAKNFLMALLESSASQEHPDLKTKAVELLKRIEQTKGANINSAKEIEIKYTQFKALDRTKSIPSANRLANYIRNNHGFWNSHLSRFPL